MANSAYLEKLRHPKWQEKRANILQRDKYKCRACGDDETELHVHHLIYNSCDPWDIEDRYLITLCKNCHEAEEILRKIDFAGTLEISGWPRISILRKIYDGDKVTRVIKFFKSNG